MNYLHTAIITNRSNLSYLLSVIPICNIGHLLLILNVTNKSSFKNKIHEEIKKHYKNINIKEKNNKYVIKCKSNMIKSKNNDDYLSKITKYFNTRGIDAKILNEHSNELISVINSNNLTEVGCRNILSKVKKKFITDEIKQLLFEKYYHIEYVRVELFDVNNFVDFLQNKQYIYLLTHQHRFVERIKTKEILKDETKKFREIVSSMTKSNNEARRHFGILLAKEFSLLDVLSKICIENDVNQTIRKLQVKKEANEDIKISAMSDYRISTTKLFNIKSTFSTLSEYDGFLSQHNISLTNNPVIYFALLNKLNENKNEQLFLETKNILREEFILGNYQKYLEVDWHIMMELLLLINKFNNYELSIKLVLLSDNYGINSNISRIFNNINITELNIDITKIITNNIINTRKSGALSAVCSMLNSKSVFFSYDVILQLYLNSNDLNGNALNSNNLDSINPIHKKFHCLNLFITMVRDKTIEIYEKEIFEIKNGSKGMENNKMVDKERERRKKIFLEGFHSEGNKGSKKLDENNNLLENFSVINLSPNDTFLICDFLSFTFILIFDALSHSHYSIVNCGITLLTILLNKLHSNNGNNIYQYFENETLRDIIFNNRNKHRMYVLLIYKEIRDILEEREIEFITKNSESNDITYERAYAKTILSKTRTDIETTRRLVFNPEVSQSKKYFHLFTLLNNYDEIEIAVALDYINNLIDGDIKYAEEGRIALSKIVREKLSEKESNEIIKLMRENKTEIVDYEYDIENIRRIK